MLLQRIIVNQKNRAGRNERGMESGLKGMGMQFSWIASAEDPLLHFPYRDGGCNGAPGGRGIG